MYRKLLLFICVLPIAAMAQVLPTPKDFLGYEPGERFTPWYKVVQYFESAARAYPNMVKVSSYGTTYEGRPLITAVLSAPEHMQRIDEIRANHLKTSGMLPGKPTRENDPVVVWMSFNVHGNEASSTEVALVMLYDILSGKHPQAAGWLKNTVLIMDPCLNPDGRDQYVSWYQRTMGKNPNPSMIARERFEPSPSGRTNHYYFDLNRDWAWQSQIETRSRLRWYNEWMPAIHVDFHEQYYNSPYYFAPAAEPLHDAISDFQRSFQEEIGRNHARYFDKNGWLYFTKEYFDLFYPAYGDTYPMFSGAIGMTYEQAGHSMGGLTIAWDGDTLTLSDRILHHYTTAMSTLEVAATQSDKIRTAYKKYFDEANTRGNGLYKTYIVEGRNAAKTAALKSLLFKNGIRYTVAGKRMQVKGYDYFGQAERTWQVQEQDLIISALQPKSALVRVLFEPHARLSDSLTYDITAWALPYAHGMQAVALKEVISGVDEPQIQPVQMKLPVNAYGYLIPYESVKHGLVLGKLLNKGIEVRFHETDFETNDKKYSKGTLIILRQPNRHKLQEIENILNQFNVAFDVMESGMMQKGADMGSDKVRTLKAPRVAVLAGERAFENSLGEVWHFFDEQLDYPVTLIRSDNPNQIDLSAIDVLVVPSGNFKFLSEKEGNQPLTDWLNKGGKMIAIDNAVSLMAEGNWQLKKKEEDKGKEKDAPANDDLPVYGERDRSYLKHFVQGAVYRVTLDHSHPIAYGFSGDYFTLRNNDNVYTFLSNGWNVGVIGNLGYISGMVGSEASGNIQQTMSVGAQPVGRGTVVYFAENPLYRGFWESGKLLLTNAVFFNW